uniref:Uncharacterized protein n=1 Tax=Oryza meridionalis TaxID=40149 RepID=A0A0E0DB37_9ORYZ
MSTSSNTTGDWKKGLDAVIERLDAIRGQISDIDNQQQSHHVAIQHLEHAHRDNTRPHRDADGDRGDDGCHSNRAPRYHKLDFPIFPNSMAKVNPSFS